MSADISKKYESWVTVIDEQAIRRLYSDISERLKGPSGDIPFDITFQVEYTDSSSSSTSNLDEVIGDDNAPGRKIESISIDGETKNYEEKVKINLGNQGITVGIKGPTRQWMYVTQSIIEDRIKGLKKFQLRQGYISLLIISVEILLLFFLKPLYENILPPLSYIDKNGDSQTGLGAWLLILIFIVFAFLTIAIINRLFPNTTFFLGREIEAYQSRVRLRSNLLWVVGIGSLLAISIQFILREVFNL
ncbi:hypothetical protein A3A35_02315 [Candidatus Kaiserbacteria bacterium RIFCSPLOWO2_01_FULL_51_21]|uniref:Uncharacterized protein n=1 Tax=Candidatus Kaiserbacteria bacterium RIFCSPLOWO2_01_FULL_51_21 TaxID=1798508 RepID=A0A1F6EEK2_9BACT|nr:MAG: hypothetical protein A3A35_02315 [Candidatus Kaiserbacteria bacterium RIFCSPLOWO2_01_FULL_51_21]